ncbi:MAG TPA: amino acid adenylation domain-containing protein [Ktedonobacteraceae bacterium]|nr:amino acid adenylation domain-containing protein [Ktedonobacteraceae bacterium]
MFASEKRPGFRRKSLRSSEITQLCQQQLQIMSRQLDLLHALPVPQIATPVLRAVAPPDLLRMLPGPAISLPALPPVEPPVTPSPTDEEGQQVPAMRILPLSEEQKELWFMSLAEESASQAYNQALSIRLLGPLNVQALEGALQALVQRHEALRTTFERKSTQQRIFSSLPLQMGYGDLSPLEGEERKRRVVQFQEAEAQGPFDLEHGPLLRTRLLKLEEDAHLLLFSLHHIVADGRSLGTLLHELSALYTAHCTGIAHTLAAPLPYSAYIQQQMALAQSAEMATAEQYWLARFAETPPALDFPTDYQRPPAKTFRGAKHHFTCAGELYLALKRVSIEHKCTLYTTLLGAYVAFLARITGQRDLVVPISSAGQFFVDGGAGLVGHCVKLLPLRITLAGDPTVSDYLYMIKQTVFEAQEHQCYPFAELVQKLKLPRDPSRMPLVATDFNLDVAGDLRFQGLGTEVQSTVSHFAQFDFSLNITQVQNELQFESTYNTDLFAPETIERWADYFQMVLQNMLHARTFADLTLLNREETQRFVRSQQRLEESYPAGSTFMDMFAAQVQRTPDAIAAACEHEQMTYAALDERAEHMAWQLSRRGVTRETLVILLAERSLDFLVSLLAVLKAGGAYLPLNTHWPEMQYTRILESSQAQYAVTTAAYLPKLRAALPAEAQDGQQVQICLLEDLAQETFAERGTLPKSEPGNLAYVIYTSGSTGIPKGAMVEHKGMLNHLFVKQQELALTAGDSVAQNASQSFDISVWQFLVCLLVGGRVQILPDVCVNDPMRLLEAVRFYSVSVLEIVPSLLQGLFLLLEATGSSAPDLTHMRWLASTGEALPPGLARQWLRTYPHVPLMNCYGPTECSDDVTHYVLVEPPSESAAQVPIGHTLANLELYVLDADMRILPPGIPGELYVGGVGVGRGYMRDPMTTATTFVPHPFHPEPGRRLYKTGDRVRFAPDGNLAFFGRIDHQVKIRGFRIELGEIEANLYRHASVRDTAVVVREDEAGEKRLVAYIVPGPGEQGQANVLRTWLREQGPEYMVPSAFVFLERLPLTPNGKLDIRALPAPVQEHLSVEGQDEVANPRNALESLLAKTWQDVLHREPVGIHDNFFELGGDSIMSIKIIARLYDAGLKLTTREIFQYQTIAELATVVAQSPSFRVEQGPITGEVPPTPVQQAFDASLIDLDVQALHGLLEKVRFDDGQS